MSSESSASRIFVGIDIAQAELVIALRPSGQQWAVPNTPEAWADLAQTLVPQQPDRIVLEATGGLERPLATALTAARFACGGGQSAASARLRARSWSLGEDRRPRCPCAGALCRSRRPRTAAAARRRRPGTGSAGRDQAKGR